MVEPSVRSHRLVWARRAKAGAQVLAWAASLLVLPACSLMPAYERPALPVALQFPGGTSTPATTGPEQGWRDHFADPRLQTLVDMALANNRDLRVAMLNVAQTRAQFQIRSADLLPTVNAAASATRQPSVVNGKLANSFSVGLAVSAWEIDLFGRLESLKAQALSLYLASEEGRKAAQTALVASVANAWLGLLADEDLLEIARQTLATREASVQLTQLRFDQGVSSALVLRQAQSLTESAKATLAQLQRQRSQDENALVLLLGQGLPAGWLDGRAKSLASFQPPAALPAGLPSDLLERRPDIRQAEQQLMAANANIGAARAAFFPRIALTASAGSSSKALSGLFESGSWGFSVAPQLLLPLFDAGRNQAGFEVAQASRAVAVAQYEKAIQTAFREVADALAARDNLGEQLRALQAQAQAERSSFQLSELRYQHGVASYLEVLDAQRSLFATEQALVQTRLAQLQSQVALYKAVGGGWTEGAAK